MKTASDVLVSADWLEQRLTDANLRVVEVVVSPVEYNEGHIPGAVMWDVYQDLKDANYDLINKKEVEELMSRSGIDEDTTIVFYGYAPALAYWLTQLYRHPDARILNLSREAWEADGRAWTNTVEQPRRTAYLLADEDDEIRAVRADVRSAIGDPDATIVDVRSEAEFSGERFWPSGSMEEGGRAGHIPSAVRVTLADVYDENGAFRSPAELEEMYDEIDLTGDQGVITYCTIGGRAATSWFILSHILGYENTRVYDGSWAEWGRKSELPVA